MIGSNADFRAPLLYRLVEGTLETSLGTTRTRALSKGALIESVRQDVERLLSTRCTTPSAVLAERGRTLQDFGMLDVSGKSPYSREDRRTIAEGLREVISAYEPRLKHVRVGAEVHPKEVHALRITVEALLVTDTLQETVTFPFIVHH